MPPGWRKGRALFSNRSASYLKLERRDVGADSSGPGAKRMSARPVSSSGRAIKLLKVSSCPPMLAIAEIGFAASNFSFYAANSSTPSRFLCMHVGYKTIPFKSISLVWRHRN